MTWRTFQSEMRNPTLAGGGTGNLSMCLSCTRYSLMSAAHVSRWSSMVGTHDTPIWADDDAVEDMIQATLDQQLVEAVPEPEVEGEARAKRRVL